MCIIIGKCLKRGLDFMHVIEKKKSSLSNWINVVVDNNTTNFWLQKLNPLWSVDQALGQIVQKEQIAHDIVSLKIQINKNFVAAQAGQHHPIVIEINGIRYERTYSLTQVDAQHVLLTAKKVDQGKVSSYLLEKAQVGDVIEFGQPYGEMTLPQQQKLIFLAAGSGITPMYSLIQELVKTGELKNRQVDLLYWVKTAEDCAFKTQFDQIAQQYPQLKLHYFFTQAESAQPRLNEQHLTLLNDIEHSAVFACGPSGFVQTVEQLFAHAQLIQTEAFSMSPVLLDDQGSVQITLTQSGKVVEIPKGQSILQALEQQNIKPTFGCRMGICNKCVCNKVEGSTQNLLNGSQNHEPGNILKLCINSAKTDLTLDL